MSRYLASRIEQTENIELLCNTTIRRMDDNGHLAAVEVENREAWTVHSVETPAVFSFMKVMYASAPLFRSHGELR